MNLCGIILRIDACGDLRAGAPKIFRICVQPHKAELTNFDFVYVPAERAEEDLFAAFKQARIVLFTIPYDACFRVAVHYRVLNKGAIIAHRLDPFSKLKIMCESADPNQYVEFKSCVGYRIEKGGVGSYTYNLVQTFNYDLDAPVGVRAKLRLRDPETGTMFFDNWAATKGCVDTAAKYTSLELHLDGLTPQNVYIKHEDDMVHKISPNFYGFFEF